MTKERLILEYVFLFCLIVVLIVIPNHYASKQMQRIEALEIQLEQERLIRAEQQRALDELQRKQEEFKRQVQCVAINVYHEARGETEQGKRAVAQVTINRTQSDKFPDDVCGVVYQRKPDGGCQFSWYCDSKPDEVRDMKAWNDSVRIAKDALDGKTVDAVGTNALYYHSRKVRPYWRNSKRFVAAIGKHLFYSERRS